MPIDWRKVLTPHESMRLLMLEDERVTLERKLLELQRTSTLISEQRHKLYRRAQGRIRYREKTGKEQQ